MEVPLTPLALVARGVDCYPDRVAVHRDDGALTYRAFCERVESLAGGLRALGVSEGDRVAVLAPNTAEALECYTGIPLSGAVIVPLNTRLSVDEYRYILSHSGATWLLADCEHLAVARELQASRPQLRLVAMGGGDGAAMDYEELATGARRIRLDPERYPEETVLSLNYTSGTTARPKGVMLTHRNTFLNAVNMVMGLGLRREDVHLHVAPMFHANGWGFVWATLGVGAANVPLRSVRPEVIFGNIERYGVTTLCAAPTVLAMLLEARRSAPGRPLRIETAGAAPPAEIIRRVEEELGWEVHHYYGLTETTAFVTGAELPEGDGPIDARERTMLKARQGLPLLLSGAVKVVRDDFSQVAADGEDLGEVVARGNVIMKGYYRDEAGTRKAFEGGWFHTGDLAVRHPDGSIEIKDRAKDMIVSGGENVPSLEVENVLYRHEAVAYAAVVAAPDPYWGERVVACVVRKEGHDATEEDLIAHCRAQLSHFKVPKEIIFLEELPRTASGKVQKYRLRDLFRHRPTDQP